MKRILLLVFSGLLFSPLFAQLDLNLLITDAPGPVDFQVVLSTDSFEVQVFELITDAEGVYDGPVDGAPNFWSAGYITFQNCQNFPVFAWFGSGGPMGLSVASVLPWCEEVAVYGCTDPEALNFDPEANNDDGSCFYAEDCESNVVEVIITTEIFGNEISWNIVDANGVEVAGNGVYSSNGSFTQYYCLPDGCYVFEMFDSFGDGWNGGSFAVVVDGGVLASGSLPEGSYGALPFSLNGSDCDSLIVYGCTDPDALNYNPDATIDDGSCAYEAAENDLCADATPLEPGWTLIDNTNTPNNEGIFGECWNFGSGEGEQSSLWFTFTTPQEPAEIYIEAIGDSTFTLTDTQFGLFEECGGEMIYCDGNGGVGLLSAFDFACGELETNTTYILMVDGWNGDQGTCFLYYEVTQPCDDNVYGCTDPEAVNYNPDATVDDGSCEYFECDANILEFVINTQSWGNEISWNIVNESGEEVAGSGNYPSNSTIWETLCLEDGCYVFEMFDSFGDGWNGAAFELLLEGNPVASGTLVSGNYGILGFGINATDCDSIIDVYGCTDPEALNYNPQATIDDGTCSYGFECGISFEVIPDSTNGNSYTVIPSDNIYDAVEVLWDFGDGTTSTDLFPTHIYEEDGPYLLCLFVTFADSIGNLCEISYCQFLSGEIFGGSGVLSGGFTVNVVEPAVLSDGRNSRDYDLSLYPNPTEGMVNIGFDSDNSELITVRVMDLHGKLLEESRVPVAHGVQNLTLDLTDLPQGIYLLGLQGSKQTSYAKVVRR